MKELSGVVKDQVEESSVMVIVLSKGLAMWRQESMNTLLHNAQLKYVDVGETRVVTNSRCRAEQIKNDRGRGDEQTKILEKMEKSCRGT